MDGEFRKQFTEISARQWDYLAEGDLTPKQAVAFLNSGMQLRTFSGNLRRLYPEKDLESRLIEGLLLFAREDGKDAKADSVRRKVQNWMMDKNVPSDREEIFRVAFALGLDEKQTDTLLLQTVEQGIHYRNEREMIYAFSLRNRQSYRTACENARIFAEQKRESQPGRDVRTQVMRLRFENLPPGEDVIGFLLRQSANLGTYHNTAYQYFRKMLDLLVGGDEQEEAYSLEYVAEHYLRMKMPQSRKMASYSDMQKVIKKYWPGSRNIKAMQNRSEDVSRKALLLLYIITGGVWDLEYDELDEEYITPKEALEEHCRRLNEMMDECGMSRMDPRNPFDYLVLYCLKPRGDDDMSRRMERVVEELFGAEE